MKTFWKYFKKPPIWLIFVIYFLTICFSVASIIFAVLGKTEAWTYIIYALAGSTLAYSVYTIVKFAPKIKSFIIDMLRAFDFTRKFLDEYSFRAIIVATVSLFVNIAYTVFNAVLAIITSSLWFGAISMYNAILIILRSDTILSRHKSPQKSFLRASILVIFLSVFLSLAVWQMVANDLSFNYPSLTIYAFAAYAFYKITTSIINLIKSRDQSLTVKATKNIGFADALVSILSLQTALLYTFSDETINTGAFNAITGALVCALTLAIGVTMLISLRKTKKTKDIYERK